jgi:acetyl esterase/lipase
MPYALRRRWSCPVVAAVLLLAGPPACRAVGSPPRVDPPPFLRTYEADEVLNVAYYQGRDADDYRHRLDLFLPKGLRDYPVLVFVHGGAWMIGDKSCVGLYSAVGRFFARHGVGVVLPNYRLSPGVRHPEHVRDVARAFAWTKRNIGRRGGDPDRLFVGGHSAGGHLAALLATDERYLEAEGLTTADVKGAILVSGVYRIPPGTLDVTLGGTGPDAFRLGELLTLPGMSGRAMPGFFNRLAIPVSLDFYGPAFGPDPEVRAAASPLSHVRPGLPPFLIFTAEDDLPTLAGLATRFHHALRQSGCDARLVTVDDRNHNSILFRAIDPVDPVAREALEFIHRHER